MTPPKKKVVRITPATPAYSCANCKHRFLLPTPPGHPLSTEAGECRRYPQVWVPGEEDDEGLFDPGGWYSPPAPADFLCGEHAIKCDS